MLQMSTLRSSQIHRTRHHSNPSEPQLLHHSINSSDKHLQNPQASVDNQDDSDDDPLIFEESMSESISTFGRNTLFYNERQQIRTSLKNFFVHPFEKYRF